MNRKEEPDVWESECVVEQKSQTYSWLVYGKPDFAKCPHSKRLPHEVVTDALRR